MAKIAELAARFCERAATERLAIADALADEDRTRIADLAHKLAGNAGMFGYPEIGEAALQLEEAAEGGSDMTNSAERLLALLRAL